LGIEAHFNLSNYFFRTRLQQVSDVEALVLGSVDFFVQSGPRVDPYFHLPMSNPLVGWQKIWFFLRNNTDAPLPTFMGNHPVPQSNWGYGADQMDLHRLQTPWEVIRILLRGGLMGVEVLRTFFCRRIHPLH
jgi:hypothetical protein